MIRGTVTISSLSDTFSTGEQQVVLAYYGIVLTGSLLCLLLWVTMGFSARFSQPATTMNLVFFMAVFGILQSYLCVHLIVSIDRLIIKILRY